MEEQTSGYFWTRIESNVICISCSSKGNEKDIKKRHPFHQQCMNDLKLAFRDTSDKGSIRSKPTPDAATLRQSLVFFQCKWENVVYNGIKILPPAAIQEIGCILKHVIVDAYPSFYQDLAQIAMSVCTET